MQVVSSGLKTIAMLGGKYLKHSHITAAFIHLVIRQTDQLAISKVVIDSWDRPKY